MNIYLHRGPTADTLQHSSSKAALSQNIETEIKAGKDPKQAAAIAYSVQREAAGDSRKVIAQFLTKQTK